MEFKMYIFVPCCKLQMASASCPIPIQTLPHLIYHLQIVLKTYLVIPIDPQHVPTSFSSRILLLRFHFLMPTITGQTLLFLYEPLMSQ